MLLLNHFDVSQHLLHHYIRLFPIMRSYIIYYYISSFYYRIDKFGNFNIRNNMINNMYTLYNNMSALSDDFHNTLKPVESNDFVAIPPMPDLHLSPTTKLLSCLT